MSAMTSLRLAPWNRLLLACTVALGTLPCAQAQSLSELYAIAHGYDATYLAARALAESAEFRAAQVHALRRPNVGLTLSGAQNVQDSSSTDMTSNTALANLRATQTLFNRANDADIAKADRALAAARADLELAEQELMVRLAQSYFDVLAAKDTLEAARANMKAISEQLASAKRNFEVGTTTITDTREAQARFDLATAQEIAASNDLTTKRIALDQLVGHVGVEPRPLATPVALPTVEPATVEDWVKYSETAPNIRKAEVGHELAQLETQKARAGRLPTLDLEGNFGRSKGTASGEQTVGVTRTAASDPGLGNTSNVIVTLKVPLFTGFAIQNRIRETLLLEEQARSTLDAARRIVAQGTRQAFYNVQSGKAQVSALEAAENSSQLALEATKLGYKVGVRVNLDVLNSQTQLFTTRRDLAKARYDVLVGGLKLRQASGQLKPEDMAAVNQLLAQPSPPASANQ